jgi:hypothetical protein
LAKDKNKIDELKQESAELQKQKAIIESNLQSSRKKTEDLIKQRDINEKILKLEQERTAELKSQLIKNNEALKSAQKYAESVSKVKELLELQKKLGAELSQSDKASLTYHTNRLTSLMSYASSYKDIISKSENHREQLKESKDTLKEISKLQKDTNDAAWEGLKIKKSDLESLTSIGNVLGKTSEMYKEISTRIDTSNTILSKFSEKIGAIKNETHRLKAINIGEAYKEAQISLISIQKSILSGVSSQQDLYEYSKKYIENLEDQLNTLSKGTKAYKLMRNGVDSMKESLSKIANDSLQKIITSSEEFKNLLNTISNQTGKQSDEYKHYSDYINDTTDTLKGLAAIISSMDNDQLKNQGIEAANGYKKFREEVALAQKDLNDEKTNLNEYNSVVMSAYKAFENLAANIDDSTEAGKQLKLAFSSVTNEAKKLNSVAKESNESISTMENAMDQLGRTGIPVLGEITDLVKSLATRDFPAAALAATALGAAIGSAVGSFAFAPMQVQIEMFNKRVQNSIDLLRSLGEIEVEYGIQGPSGFQVSGVQTARGGIDAAKVDLQTQEKITEIGVDRNNIQNKLVRERARAEIEHEEEINKLRNEGAFAAQRAMIQFNAQMQQAAVQFKAAAKTALFGDKLGSVGYGAAKLQMAGISADKIASAMSEMGRSMGRMPSAAMAADMVVMAERTGTSTEEVVSINKLFQKTEGVTAEVAINLTEGMRELAENAGLPLNNLMQEVASASKEALGYQIRSGASLVKQVGYAQSMGISFNDVAKAGRSMVLNYRDSIKSEMQLSALLGRQVDLSEVRAQFNEGNVAGAIDALKAQGLDPTQMNMQQQEALTRATGMDLETLRNIAQNPAAAIGNLGTANAKRGGEQFLNRKIEAERQMQVANAKISAATAILDAELSNKILMNYLNSKEVIATRNKLLDEEIKQAELEGAIQKQKINALLDPTLVQMRAKIAIFEALLAKLTGDMQSRNAKIIEAETQQKRFDPLRQLSEGLIPALSGTLGGILGFGMGKKMFGGPATPPTTDVTTRGSKTRGSKTRGPKIKGSKPTISSPSAGKGGWFKNMKMPKMGKGGKAGLILAGLGLAAWGGSKLFGGGDEEAELEPGPTGLPSYMGSEEYLNSINPQPDISGYESYDGFSKALTQNVVPVTIVGYGNLAKDIGSMTAGTFDRTQQSKLDFVEKAHGVESTPLAAAGIMGSVALGRTIHHGQQALGDVTIGAIKNKFGRKASEEVGEQVMHKGAKGGFMKQLASEFGHHMKHDIGKSHAFIRGGTDLAKGSLMKSLTTGTAASAGIGSKVMAGIGQGVGKVAGTGPIGILASVASTAADIYGDYKKDRAKITGDKSELNTGRNLKIAAGATEGLMYGAMIGSFIPVVGTVVGGIVGAAVGGLMSTYKQYFSEQAVLDERQVELAGIANDVNQRMETSIARSLEMDQVYAGLSADEPSWRQAMLEQTVELTRIIDAIAFDILPAMASDTLDEKIASGDIAKRGTYDVASVVGAKKGYAPQMDEKQTNIANFIKATEASATGSAKSGGVEMSLAQYVEKYKVSNKEVARVRELMELQKLSAAAPKPTTTAVTTTGAATTTTGAATTTTGTTAGSPTTTTAAVSNTDTILSTIQQQAHIRGIIMGGKLDMATMALSSIQTQADTRGIIMVTKMDTMASILTDMGLNMAKIAGSAYSEIDNEWNTNGYKLDTYNKLVDINGNAQRLIARNDKIANFTMQSSKNLANLDLNMKQLLQVNKNLQTLIDAQVTGANENNIKLLIDGKQVTRVIKIRQSNMAGQNPTKQ